MHQPSIFWRSEVTEQIGLLNDRFDYAFDFDYWVRIAEYYAFCEVDATLAGTLYHPAAKTGDGYRRYHAELRKHARSYWGITPPTGLLATFCLDVQRPHDPPDARSPPVRHHGEEPAQPQAKRRRRPYRAAYEVAAQDSTV